MLFQPHCMEVSAVVKTCHGNQQGWSMMWVDTVQEKDWKEKNGLLVLKLGMWTMKSPNLSHKTCILGTVFLLNKLYP